MDSNQSVTHLGMCGRPDETVKARRRRVVSRFCPECGSLMRLLLSDFTALCDDDRMGYQVQYPDGYVSWSPKEVFETAYRIITPAELKMLSPGA